MQTSNSPEYIVGNQAFSKRFKDHQAQSHAREHILSTVITRFMRVIHGLPRQPGNDEGLKFRSGMIRLEFHNNKCLGSPVYQIREKKMKKPSLASLFLAAGLFSGAAAADQNLEELYPPPTQSFEVSACTADYKTATMTIDVWGEAKAGIDKDAMRETLQTFWKALVDGHESPNLIQYKIREDGTPFNDLAHAFYWRGLDVAETLGLKYQDGKGKIGSAGPPAIGAENSCTP